MPQLFVVNCTVLGLVKNEKYYASCIVSSVVTDDHIRSRNKQGLGDADPTQLTCVPQRADFALEHAALVYSKRVPRTSRICNILLTDFKLIFTGWLSHVVII